MKNARNKNVVLVGGGHTHALVLRSLKAGLLTGADVIVINPEETAPYSGMLPGFVAGHYSRDEPDINLDKLTAQVGGKLIVDRAVGLDQPDRAILLESGAEVEFDIASVDVRITSKNRLS